MSAPSPVPRRTPRWLPVVLLGYVLLAVIYSVSTPIMEAPDEMFHFPLVSHLADSGRLPVQDPEVETAWHQEGSQPPLYYALAALLVRPIDRSDLEARLARNPHAKIGVGLATDNQVTLLHDWEAESFPWHGTALAVHLVRLFSIALGAGTVLAIYHIARLAAPGQPALHLTAVLLAAFNPMFLFISSSVNNDNLVNLLSAAGLALILALWRGGLTNRRLWALALVLALAALSKLSGLALYATAGVALLLVARRDRLPLGRLVRAALVLGGVWLAVGGWWYARNVYYYGEPTGMSCMIDVIGARGSAFTLGTLADELEGLRLSFWGVFGMLNVIAPDSLLDYTNMLSLLALLGLALYAVRALVPFSIRPEPAEAVQPHNLAFLPPSLARLERGTRGVRSADLIPPALLAFHTLVVLLALLNWTRRTPASQGRLLFPALGALATLAALGLAHLIPRASWRWMTPVFVAPLVAFGVAIPFTTLQPAYALPAEVGAVPAGAIPTDARFGPIELLGVKVSDTPAVPGSERDGLDITLYWRPLAHTDAPMSLYVQALGLPAEDGELEPIGKVDSYPGGGLLQTTAWDLNRIYADRYRISILPGVRTPVQPALKIGWRQFETGAEFDALTLAGAPRAPVMVYAGRVVGDGHTLSQGTPSEALFDGRLRLNRSAVTPENTQPGETVTVALEWEARARTVEDFTILVHLIEPAQADEPIAQGDAPPLAGRWPTSAWVPNVPFVDTHQVIIPPETPPGEYHIALGFYRPADFTRLPVDTQLDTLPGAVILPQTLTVEGADAHD